MSSIPEIIQLSFDVDDDGVYLCLQGGGRAALFPSEGLSPFNLENSLQQAIVQLVAKGREGE